MPRAKKEGEKISLYIDKETSDRIRAYAEEKGQTLTMSIERAINGFLDIEDKKAEPILTVMNQKDRSIQD